MTTSSLNKSLLTYNIYSAIELNNWTSVKRIWQDIQGVKGLLFTANNFEDKIKKLDEAKEQAQRQATEHEVALLRFWKDFYSKKRKFVESRPLFYIPIFADTPKVYFSESEEVNPIAAAAELGRYDVLHFLLENCPKEDLPRLLREKTNDGYTAMHLAAMQGHTAIVNLLCDYYKEANLSLDELDGENQTAVYRAFMKEHYSTVVALASKGANTYQIKNIPDQEMAKLILDALEQNNHNRVALLLDQCTKENDRAIIFAQKTNYEGNTVLHLAAKKGNEETVRLLCTYYAAANVSINEKNNAGQTPLHMAVFYGQTNAETILTSAGADKEIKDAQEKTAQDYRTAQRVITKNPAQKALAGALASQTVQSLYDEAVIRVTDYHSTTQCCVRRINERIGELSEDATKAFSMNKELKRKKVTYLTLLRTEIEKRPNDEPKKVIEDFRAAHPEKYLIIVSGWMSKKTNTLIGSLENFKNQVVSQKKATGVSELLIGPSSAQGENHDHKYLIERNAAYEVCTSLIEKITSEVSKQPALKEKGTRILLALRELTPHIIDRDKFDVSIQQIVETFKTQKAEYYSWLASERDFSCDQLINLLQTLEQKCLVPVRKSMDISAMSSM